MANNTSLAVSRYAFKVEHHLEACIYRHNLAQSGEKPFVSHAEESYITHIVSMEQRIGHLIWELVGYASYAQRQANQIHLFPQIELNHLDNIRMELKNVLKREERDLKCTRDIDNGCILVANIMQYQLFNALFH